MKTPTKKEELVRQLGALSAQLDKEENDRYSARNYRESAVRRIENEMQQVRRKIASLEAGCEALAAPTTPGDYWLQCTPDAVRELVTVRQDATPSGDGTYLFVDLDEGRRFPIDQMPEAQWWPVEGSEA